MFRHSLSLLSLVILAAAAGGAACTVTDEPTSSDESELMIHRVRETVELELDKVKSGKFERKVRVYGFRFEAKAGAKIKVDLSATAGSDAEGLQEGAALDTVAAIYGPLRGDGKGEQLAHSDDGGTSNADLPQITIKEDGTYIIALGSWDDPGTNGTYSVKAACEGTSFQCRRPVKPSCEDNVRYIQGGTKIGTETWNDCTVVLLEEVHVEPGAVLTINPGVTVKGNFIGNAPYGSIGLVVDGAIQAVGTEEHPVVFTALKEGWKGLTLNGNSSTLEHVYVEKAETGVAVRGSHNTFKHINVNSGGLGLHFGANSKANIVDEVRIDKVDNGIRLAEGSDAAIHDSVILGRGDGTGVGIEAKGAEMSDFSRALVADFGDGLKLDATQLVVTDGTITNNMRGVTMTGPRSGVNPTFPACPNTDLPARPAPPPRPPVTFFQRDPVFIHCDITKNLEYGIRVTAPEMLVVEDSNVRDNGAGIVIASDAIHEESRIVRSNIFGNGNGLLQVDSSHEDGTLDISGNFWNQISDPELSSSWKVSQTAKHTCRATGCGTQSCGSSYSCARSVRRDGPQGRTTYWDDCTATVTASWTGAVTFTGFSPRQIADAGPRERDLCDMVRKERTAQQSR